jgi:flagellar hook-basal body complex protein FliE
MTESTLPALPATPFSFTITPGAAVQAYQQATSLQSGDLQSGASATAGFGAVLDQAVQSAIATGHQADAQTATALQGKGDLTSTVMALSQAELALQTAATLRDHMVGAYQEVMRMPI